MTVCHTCHVGEKNDALNDINKEMIFAGGQLQKRIHFFFKLLMSFFICICFFFIPFLLCFYQLLFSLLCSLFLLNTDSFYQGPVMIET